MKIEIKKFFRFYWREKTPENKGGLPVFFYFEFVAPIPTMEKNVKLAETVAIAVTKHPAKFGIKNCREEKL